MVKCWNCSTDFEIVSSAENTNKHTVQSIAEVLRSNMFDAQRGGMMVVNMDDTIDEISEIISEYLNNYE
jgi:uncharacterized Zn finger protein (UPF0148 family)